MKQIPKNSGRGGDGGRHQVFQRLWAPPIYSDLIQIHREGNVGSGKRLAGGGEELGPGKDDVEEDVAYPQQGGSKVSGVRILLKGRDIGGTTLWRRDLGGHSTV